MQQAHPLIGREPELRVLSEFLGGQSRTGCVVLSGDAGMGKTTLWQMGREMALGAGFRVLSTRASQGETGLLFAGVADLVDGIDAAVLTGLPRPQHHALEVALRRVDPDPQPPEPFAISAGFQAAVRALATDARVLLAIDDADWLDASTAECLLFLARRLAGPDVRFLLSRRSGEPPALELALEPLGVELVEVGPLSVGAIGRLLSERLDLVLPRRVLRQLFDASLGNPLFALELGRAIRAGGLPGPDVEPPLPRRIDEAFRARVRDLPDGQRRALLAASLSAGIRRVELEAIAGPVAVEEAFDVGLLDLDGERVRASHPMLGAAVRRESSAEGRRELHHDLAEVVADTIVSARHRALAATGPDSDAAGALAAAAQLAADRGATHEAAELAAHALRLTPPGAAEEPERVLDLARHHFNAVEYAAAQTLLKRYLDRLPPGRPRNLARLLLAQTSSSEVASATLDHLIGEAGDDEDLLERALSHKAMHLAIDRAERLPEARELARMARSHAVAGERDAISLVASAWVDAMTGIAIEPPPAGDAHAFGAGTLESLDRPIGVQRAFRGEVAVASAILGRLVDLADEWGRPRTRGGVVRQLCEFALRAGDLAAVGPMLAEVEQWNAIPELRIAAARLEAVAAAIAGRPAEARHHAAVVLDPSRTPAAPPWDRLEATRAIGIASLLERDFPSAVTSLDSVWQHCRREGIDDPGAFPVAGDLVEALVESASPEAGAAVLTDLERLSREQNHPWGLATSKRATAMIGMAGGSTAAGVRDLTQAATDYGRLGLWFEQARCLLYLGRVQRRSKQRAEARTTLASAAESFERLGCLGWAAIARSEIDRLAGRRPVAKTKLTPTEQRVVDLAARGLSNKQIATELYVGVHTVEVHLSHAFAKLGVESRSQLAPRLSIDTPGR